MITYRSILILRKMRSSKRPRRIRLSLLNSKSRPNKKKKRRRKHNRRNRKKKKRREQLILMLYLLSVIKPRSKRSQWLKRTRTTRQWTLRFSSWSRNRKTKRQAMKMRSPRKSCETNRKFFQLLMLVYLMMRKSKIILSQLKSISKKPASLRLIQKIFKINNTLESFGSEILHKQ